MPKLLDLSWETCAYVTYEMCGFECDLWMRASKLGMLLAANVNIVEVSGPIKMRTSKGSKTWRSKDQESDIVADPLLKLFPTPHKSFQDNKSSWDFYEVRIILLLYAVQRARALTLPYRVRWCEPRKSIYRYRRPYCSCQSTSKHEATSEFNALLNAWKYRHNKKGYV